MNKSNKVVSRQFCCKLRFIIFEDTTVRVQVNKLHVILSNDAFKTEIERSQDKFVSSVPEGMNVLLELYIDVQNYYFPQDPYGYKDGKHPGRRLYIYASMDSVKSLSPQEPFLV